MTMEELAAQVADLQGVNADRAAAEEQKGFIDKYGTMFSGDEGIGMAILAEMNRRGVPSAAVGADRVVQEILDSIRQEATMILDKIKADKETVNTLIDQVKDIQESVAAATEGSTPGDGVLDVPPAAPGPAVEGGEIMPPPDMGAPPPPEGMPPMDAGAMPPPPEAGGEVSPMPEAPIAGEMPPPEAPAPELPMPPMPSDKRVKRFTVKPKVPVGWKPPAHLMSAITGGK